MSETLYRSTAAIGETVGRTLVGTAMPFDKVTPVRDLIRGRVGPQYLEAFAPQSTDRTRAQHADFPVFEGHDPSSQPLGVVRFTRSDAEAALLFEAPISKTRAGDEMLELAQDGAYRSVSIGFRPVQAAIRRMANADNVTYRTEVALRHLAIAPTGYGQYEDAVVSAIRSDGDQDPGALIQAIDAAIDAAFDALEAHNLGQAQALLTAADVAVDALMGLFGLVDADDVPEAQAARAMQFEEVKTRMDEVRAKLVVPGTPYLLGLQRRRARTNMQLASE